MVHGLQTFFRGFAFAGRGLFAIYRAERNVRVHVLAAYVALSVAFVEPLSATSRAVVVGIVSTVLCAEALNTAIERTLDRQSLARDPLARQAKDAAAGAVLVVALGAVVIAMLILVPGLRGLGPRLGRVTPLDTGLWLVGFSACLGGVFLPRANDGQGRHV